MNSEVVLSVKNLETEFQTDDGAVQVLHGVS
ncbi:ABC transporter ATP-binding protein, partial [Vibrio vulnificus]|nr:ABC transporter ATP-binding protein [Vibrio vulnificus]